MQFRKRTAKQAEAARCNGAQSRGPVTPDGKAASSQNALKHGITTRDVVLHTENPALFAQYRQIFLDKFQPADPYELDLTEQLAAIAWRLRRAESTETALLDIPAAWAVTITKLSDESNSLLNMEHMQRRSPANTPESAPNSISSKAKNEKKMGKRTRRRITPIKSTPTVRFCRRRRRACPPLPDSLLAPPKTPFTTIFTFL